MPHEIRATKHQRCSQTRFGLFDDGAGRLAQKLVKVEASKVVSQSNLIKQIGNQVIKTINSPNSSKTKVRDTIKKVVASYSKEMVEI